MSGARILLVEDEPILCDLLKRNLEARQHQVCRAQDARTALVALRTMPFDLVILDINLPDQTGWEVLRIAQREGLLFPQMLNGDTPHLPVVVVSAVRAGLGRLQTFPLLAYLAQTFPVEGLLPPGQEAAPRKQAR